MAAVSMIQLVQQLVQLLLILVSLQHELVQGNPSSLLEGYLLVLKVYEIDSDITTYNHVSLFNVSLNGAVIELWNITLDKDHLMFNENGYAFDMEDELVYLSLSNRFFAVDLHTGKTVLSFNLTKPNLQYYITYDFDRNQNTFYGVCSGNEKWNWCKTTLINNNQNVTLDFLYQLPYTTEYGPVDYVFDTDPAHQLIWYLPSYIQTFVIGVNTSSGLVIYKSGPSNASCICHDYKLNKTFGIVVDVIQKTITLTEVQPHPTPDKVLLQLPSDLRLDFFNSCTMTNHIILALMGSMDTSVYMYHSMPIDLLMIDVVQLTYKRVPLPGFRRNWDSSNSITGVRYIDK